MRKLLFILVALLTAQHTFAQPSQIKRTWHWYFGNRAGIDFSSGTAVADTNGALITSEGCAAISDTAGNLQFYSDGRTVWNRLHQIMPNGTGIMGGAMGSSTQAALIIPKPLSPNLYYLFTTDEAENQGANGMRYSVIDMNLDGGNGDVISSQKNILLFAPCTEKLAAVNHCNDTSVWVMGHEVNNNHFRAYLVTSNGIDTNAVISAIGFPNMMNAFAAISGSLNFSSDGKMLTTSSDTSLRRVEVCQFNNDLGIVSNCNVVAINHFGSNSVIFSNDNTKLYNGGTQNLYQYDISIFDSLAIVNSQVLISSIPNKGFRDLQNTSNEKLFIMPFSLGVDDSLIYKIELPNNSGVGCQLTELNLGISSYIIGAGCLPNFNQSYFRASNNTVCTTGIQSNYNYNKIDIFPNLARDWIEVRGSKIDEIRIFDLTGRMIFHSYPLPASPYLPINVASFPRGLYIISVKVDQLLINRKIVLQ